MRHHLGVILVAFLTSISFVAFAPVSYAAVLPTGAFIVSPAKQELTLRPGETKTINLTLMNGTSYPLTITGSYEDVVTTRQSSPSDDPVKLSRATEGKDSLSSLINFPMRPFDLLSGKEIEIPVTITLPRDSVPGGRYGSVVWTFNVIAKPGQVSPANVALKSRIATLFFIRVEGNIHEEGQLVSFGTFNDETRVAEPASSSPLRFELSYENRGNVYLDPYGRVTVSGMFSDPKVLFVDPWAVLPGAIRMREIDLFAPLMPGFYHAHLELNRGYKDIVDERDVTFWVMPSVTEWVVGCILLLLLTLLIRRSLSLSRHTIS
jgi:hypothetical protein